MTPDRVFELLAVQFWQVALVGLIAWIVAITVASDRPHLAHALWALVLLKCVTPPIWSSPTSPFSWSVANERDTVMIETTEASKVFTAPAIAKFQTPTERAEVLISARRISMPGCYLKF